VSITPPQGSHWQLIAASMLLAGWTLFLLMMSLSN
jgi:hypothetical protein